MAETIFGNGNDQWVCPNDRQLALRAKLQTGWSVHTFQTDRQRKTQALSGQEMEVILEVIRRAERLDLIEQQRIGYSGAQLPVSSLEGLLSFLLRFVCPSGGLVGGGRFHSQFINYLRALFTTVATGGEGVGAERAEGDGTTGH
ncbi:UNVERIFIED_CONTAM: hypothetical protein K2H54_033254 [Gekko kuhli]